MKPLATPVRSQVPSGHDHEELVVAQGARSGATMAVAIHSTTLGPALGGVRLWRYESADQGIDDALRLARGMTFKAAAAGLALGGGKGVICAPAGGPPLGQARTALLHDFGDLVAGLEGRYVTAEDVGTAPADMVEIATRTTHVTGLPEELGGAGDPSPSTALGVQAAMRAACAAAFGEREVGGRTVVVAGLGHVGERLARSLVEAGAQLTVSDIDPAKRSVAEELGADWVEPAKAAIHECDVFSPCAVGGAIHAGNVEELRCRIVCGAANNQLADERLAERLASRGILFAPDFIANAGGIINIYREIEGLSARRAVEMTLAIEETMATIITRASSCGVTPLDAAHELAAERLAGRV